MTDNKKVLNCKVCGAEIAKSAKTCPKCGANNKKPIYKRTWLWILVAVFVIGIAAGGSGSNEDKNPSPNTEQSQTQQENIENSTTSDGGAESAKPTQEAEEISYIQCTADEMMDALDNNALKASQTYDDQYIEVTGRLSTIDSSGDYISILPVNDQFAFIGIQCYIQNDEQLNAVAEMSIDDTITVRGKVTDVGEVMGYTLKIDNFA